MKNKPKILVTLGGGGYAGECLIIIQHLKDKADIVYACSQYIQPSDKGTPKGDFIVLPDVQSFLRGTKLTTFISGIVIFLKSLVFIYKQKPDLVAGVTNREAIFVLAAARLLGVQTLFIESVTRVDKPSLALKLISMLRIAKNIWVQWPELAEKVHNAKYVGRVI